MKLDPKEASKISILWTEYTEGRGLVACEAVSCRLSRATRRKLGLESLASEDDSDEGEKPTFYEKVTPPWVCWKLLEIVRYSPQTSLSKSKILNTFSNNFAPQFKIAILIDRHKLKHTTSCSLVETVQYRPHPLGEIKFAFLCRYVNLWHSVYLVPICYSVHFMPICQSVAFCVSCADMLIDIHQLGRWQSPKARFGTGFGAGSRCPYPHGAGSHSVRW